MEAQESDGDGLRPRSQESHSVRDVMDEGFNIAVTPPCPPRNSIDTVGSLALPAGTEGAETLHQGSQPAYEDYDEVRDSNTFPPWPTQEEIESFNVIKPPVDDQADSFDDFLDQLEQLHSPKELAKSQASAAELIENLQGLSSLEGTGWKHGLSEADDAEAPKPKSPKSSVFSRAGRSPSVPSELRRSSAPEIPRPAASSAPQQPLLPSEDRGVYAETDDEQAPVSDLAEDQSPLAAPWAGHQPSGTDTARAGLQSRLPVPALPVTTPGSQSHGGLQPQFTNPVSAAVQQQAPAAQAGTLKRGPGRPPKPVRPPLGPPVELPFFVLDRNDQNWIQPDDLDVETRTAMRAHISEMSSSKLNRSRYDNARDRGSDEISHPHPSCFACQVVERQRTRCDMSRSSLTVCGKCQATGKQPCGRLIQHPHNSNGFAIGFVPLPHSERGDDWRSIGYWVNQVPKSKLPVPAKKKTQPKPPRSSGPPRTSSRTKSRTGTAQ